MFFDNEQKNTTFDIINQLENTPKTNDKISILKANKENEELKLFFKLALDPSINYYLKKIPNYSTAHKNEKSFTEAMDDLNKLSSRMFTGNKAKFFISKLLTSLSANNANLIQRILKRDPNCKVSVATVNKVWNKLIILHPTMLCERSTEKNINHIINPLFSENKPAIIQEKSDGLRINIIYKDGNITFISRNGNFIQTHGVFDNQIKKIYSKYNKNFVIDGEGLVIKLNKQNIHATEWLNFVETELFEPRTVGNGIFNKCIQNTVEKEDTDLLRLKVWDIIPYDEYFSDIQKGTEENLKRITILKNILKDLKLSKIGLTLTKFVYNEKQIFAFYNRMLDIGKEGAILKNPLAVWENKRSKEQVKFKIAKEIDLLCVGTYPHKKKKDQIGGLILESSDKKVKVNCGSGLKDNDRKLSPNNYIGNIIEIKTNGLETSQIKDTHSLFLPIFKGIRIDKSKADSLDDIIKILNSF